jgi:hypothetical protein
VLLLAPDIRALGRIAEWARSSGCALAHDTGPKIARAPGWLVVAPDAFGDPEDMRNRLRAFRPCHPATQVMLVSARAGSGPVPAPDVSICDVTLPDPPSYDAIEKAVRVMQLNNLAWQARSRSRLSPA